MYILFKITDSKGKVGKKNHLQQLPVIANYCEGNRRKRFRNYEPLCSREREGERERERQWGKKKTSRLHETQLTSSTKLPPDHYKNHLIAKHFVRSIDSNWKNNKKLIMLQMRPWKMSLLLEGNNNSKFQLLLTLQSSVFPSERIRRQGESEFASVDFFSLLAPLFSSSLCSPLFCLVPHNPTHPALSLQKSIHPIPFHQQIDTPLPAHLLEEKGWGDKERSAAWSPAFSRAGHCPLGKLPSTPFPPACHILPFPFWWLPPHLLPSLLNIDNGIRRQLMSVKFLWNCPSHARPVLALIDIKCGN